MADIKEFYDEKRRSHKRLVKELADNKHPGQPEAEDYHDQEEDETIKRHTCVYMTSVRKREAGTTAGHVCLVTIWDYSPQAPQGGPGLAAERIADGTHRVATLEEINKHLQHQIAQKRQHDKEDNKREVKKMQMTRGESVDEMPEHLQALAESSDNKKQAAPAKK